MDTIISREIAEAVNHIKQGGIIAYPTSTIWGLGCDCVQQDAVLRLHKLKGRSADKRFLLVAGAWQEFAEYFSHLSGDDINKITAEYPYPRSWLVENKSSQLSYLVQGDKIVIRIDRHPLLQAITKALGQPIISTSANPSGEAPATCTTDISKYFASKIDYIFPNDDSYPHTGVSARPSDIVDLATGKYLRGG